MTFVRLLISIYSAIILPYLNYCNTAWSNSTYLLEKKAIRIITHSPFSAHIKPLFAKLKILNVFDINYYNIANVMYLCSKNIIPRHISLDFLFQ